jgi:hypothetical protein
MIWLTLGMNEKDTSNSRFQLSTARESMPTPLEPIEQKNDQVNIFTHPKLRGKTVLQCGLCGSGGL